MRLKLGKIINSVFQNGNCCCIFNKYRKVPLIPTTSSSGTPKVTFTQNLRLIYYTFFYNEDSDSLMAVETMLQPFMGFMNLFLRYLGKIFVLLVWVLTLNMLYTFYVVILPEIYEEESFVVFLVNLVFGSWVSVNVFFHYVMGWLTNPGQPPNTKFENVVTICKKCIGPKPARTHHCSVCRRCVLKMDHHCPWFDNCIGFYNHRYFFMFCTFITMACIYLISFGFYYYQHQVYPHKNYNVFSLLTESWMDSDSADSSATQLHHKLTTIEFFVLFAAVFGVGGLAGFNAFIISNGATNIELRFVKMPFCGSNNQAPNIYDLGFLNNWKLFLGFTDLKSFLLRVVLPSSHKPTGDGVNWYAYLNYPKSSVLQETETFTV